jgi:hypothetical protein
MRAAEDGDINFPVTIVVDRFHSPILQVDTVLRYLVDHLRRLNLPKQIANRFRLSRSATHLPLLTAVNPRRPIAIPGWNWRPVMRRSELCLPFVHGFTGRIAKTRHALLKVAAE